jgi:hypothetical protein
MAGTLNLLGVERKYEERRKKKKPCGTNDIRGNRTSGMIEISAGDEKNFIINYFNANWRPIVEKFQQIDWETRKLNFQKFSIFFLREIAHASNISGKIGKAISFEDRLSTLGCLDGCLGVSHAKSSRSCILERLTEEKELKKVFIFTFFSHFLFFLGSFATRSHRLPKLAVEAAPKGKKDLWDPGGWDFAIKYRFDGQLHYSCRRCVIVALFWEWAPFEILPRALWDQISLINGCLRACNWIFFMLFVGLQTMPVCDQMEPFLGPSFTKIPHGSSDSWSLGYGDRTCSPLFTSLLRWLNHWWKSSRHSIFTPPPASLKLGTLTMGLSRTYLLSIACDIAAGHLHDGSPSTTSPAYEIAVGCYIDTTTCERADWYRFIGSLTDLTTTGLEIDDGCLRACSRIKLRACLLIASGLLIRIGAVDCRLPPSLQLDGWHGTTMTIAFFAHALPAARTAFELPARSARSA